MEESERLDRWRSRGETVEFRGRRVHLVRSRGRAPALVFLHGFPSSSFDWHALLELEPARSHAVVAFDFLGFGLSDKPRDHDYTLAWQTDLAEELIRGYADGRAFVVAHDMGTSVATELMARELEDRLSVEIDGALLFNGSVVLDRASPTTAQKLLRSRLGPLFARLTSERFFRRQFARLFSDGHPLSEEDASDQWALIARGGGHRIAHRLIGYMDERERYAERWHGAVRDWPGPLSLAWGMRDPVATTSVLEALLELRPEAPVAELGELAHYPQIEAPEQIASALAEALGDPPRAGD